VPRQPPVVHNRGLGEYFRELRRNLGWSLSRAVLIAEQRRLPVSRGALRWLEGGLTKNPEPELLRALSSLYGEPYGNIVQEVTRRVFGIDPRELLGDGAPPTSTEDFVTLPVLNSKHDTRLAFAREFLRPLTRPVVLRVGRKEVSMRPTIEPGDIVLVDQNLTRRRRPPPGRIYAINEGPLTGSDGGVLQRVEVADRTLILSADNPDRSRHPIRTFDLKGKSLPDVLVGEVVWIGRSMGSEKRR